MKKRKRLLLWGLNITCIVSLAAAESLRPNLPSEIESITSSDIKSGIYFLASDEMRGREINTPSNEITAAYLAHRFELMGLTPIQGNSYFQYFTLVQANLANGNLLEIRSQRRPFRLKGILKKNFFPSTLSANHRVVAPAVFAGYGITAPEHGYDDYQGLDVYGKIVIVINREPGRNDPRSPFDGLVDSDYSQTFHKIVNAQAHHAAGLVIILSEPLNPGDETFSLAARNNWPENTARRKYQLKKWVDRIQIPVVYVSSEIIEPTLNTQGTSLDKVQKQIDENYRSRGFQLPGVKLKLHTAVVRTESRVQNVLAHLPGSDPKLKDQTVIVSAHFDHVGTRNGKVFNGADDDASGTVGLLEIAEAYSLQIKKPRRSMIFAAWNAEEFGLLGSQYYVEQPSFPLEQTVAVLQMDMIGRNEEILDPNNHRFRGLEKQRAENNCNSVNILGYSRSQDLHHLANEANKHIGLELKFRYDNHPLNFLRRSDNWPFLAMGVPSLFFHTGLHPDYHQPTDTPEKINYSKIEKIVRLIFLCSWDIANDLDPPLLDSNNLKHQPYN